jgi:hypothetical protein
MQNSVNVVIQETDLGLYPEGAMLPVNTHYNGSFWLNNLRNNASLLQPTNGMISAIKSGWFFTQTDLDVELSELPVTCLSGNCTWFNSSTLAISRVCRQADVKIFDAGDYATSTQANISSRIVYADRTSSFTNFLMRTTWVFPDSSPFRQLNSQIPIIIRVATIGSRYDDKDNKVWEASECALYWSVKRTRFTVTNYTSQSGMIAEEYGQTEFNTTKTAVRFDDRKDIVLAPNQPCTVNGTKYDARDPMCTFTASWEAHRGLQNFLQEFLFGWGIWAGAETGLVTDDTETRIFYSTFALSKFYSKKGLTYVTDMYLFYMSYYMSNNLRLYWSVVPTSKGETLDRVYVYGSSSVSELYYSINKRFAYYPLAILSLSILFLLFTMFMTRNELKWKNSVLAVFHAGTGYQSHAKPETVAEMDDASHEILQLRRDEIDKVLRLRVPLSARTVSHI